MHCVKLWNNTILSMCIFVRSHSNNTEGNKSWLMISGILMILAWCFFGTIGLLMTKYYKPMWPNKRFYGQRYWFIVSSSQKSKETFLHTDLLNVINIHVYIADDVCFVGCFSPTLTVWPGCLYLYWLPSFWSSWRQGATARWVEWSPRGNVVDFELFGLVCHWNHFVFVL